MLKIASLHQLYADQVTRLKRQQGWLIDLQRLLKPSQECETSTTSQQIETKVDHYLVKLAQQDLDEIDRPVAEHIITTFRNRWWGLFVCYDVSDLPPTNNDLERYIRRIKTGHRRVTGRKNVHDFIIRYGRHSACVDYRESIDDLLARLRQVSHEDFLRERQALDTALLREQKRHRFRHHQPAHLRELEDRWAAAVEKASS